MSSKERIISLLDIIPTIFFAGECLRIMKMIPILTTIKIIRWKNACRNGESADVSDYH